MPSIEDYSDDELLAEIAWAESKGLVEAPYLRDLIAEVRYRELRDRSKENDKRKDDPTNE